MSTLSPFILIEAGQTELGEILFHLEHPVMEGDVIHSYYLKDIRAWCEERNLHLDEEFINSGRLVVGPSGKVYLPISVINQLDKYAPISSAWPFVKAIREEFFWKIKSSDGADKYV